MSSHSPNTNNAVVPPGSCSEEHPSELPHPDSTTAGACVQELTDPAVAHDRSTLAHEDDDCVSIHFVLVDDVQDDGNEWSFTCADFEREEFMIMKEPSAHLFEDFSSAPSKRTFRDVPSLGDTVSVVYSFRDEYEETVVALHDDFRVAEDVWLVKEGSLEDL